jgi:hypothetical protein
MQQLSQSATAWKDHRASASEKPATTPTQTTLRHSQLLIERQNETATCDDVSLCLGPDAS